MGEGWVRVGVDVDIGAPGLRHDCSPSCATPREREVKVRRTVLTFVRIVLLNELVLRSLLLAVPEQRKGIGGLGRRAHSARRKDIMVDRKPGPPPRRVVRRLNADRAARAGCQAVYSSVKSERTPTGTHKVEL